MKLPIGLVLMFFCSQICRAQVKNSGTVLDEKGNPVKWASLHILNTDVSMLSDEAGQFSLPALPKGNYTVEISAIGYAKIEKQIQIPQGAEKLVFRLARSTTQLDAVVVTAEKQESDIQKVPISITALSSRDIDAYRLWASRDLKGIVSNLYAADPGDGRNVISIRGIVSTSYDPAVVTYI